MNGKLNRLHMKMLLSTQASCDISIHAPTSAYRAFLLLSECGASYHCKEVVIALDLGRDL